MCVQCEKYLKKKHVFFCFRLDSTDRVNHKPIITDPPQNSTLKIGEALTWRCKIISDLHKHVQWLYCGLQKNCSEEPTLLKVMVVFYLTRAHCMSHTHITHAFGCSTFAFAFYVWAFSDEFCMHRHTCNPSTPQ